MPIHRLYAIVCPNDRCSDRIVLPRQSHLGTFEYPINQSTDVWPIRYLCQRNKQWYAAHAEAIRPASVDRPDPQPRIKCLVHYVFSNGNVDDLQRVNIYTDTKTPWTENGDLLIEHLLMPSGLWKDSYGKAHWVSEDLLYW
jgi:hypothetical protein